MGVVKLQWEQKYYRSCYVLSAPHLLTSNTWVIVRTRGTELYTYWSAAYKFHKLNKVLCIFHFFFRKILSKGLCFMLIPPTKRSSVFQHFFIRVFPHIYVSFSSSHCPPLGRFSRAVLLLQWSSVGQVLTVNWKATDTSFCRRKALHRKPFFPKQGQPFCARLLPTVSRQGNNHHDLWRLLEIYKFT